jgi:hypothetical protein
MVIYLASIAAVRWSASGAARAQAPGALSAA